MARLPDPTESLTGTDRKIYDEMLARRRSQGTGLYGPYTALMHHPELAQRIEQLGYYFKFESTLPRDVYQFVVLDFAKRVGSEFEWRDHVAPASEAGLPDDVVDALERGEGRSLPDPYGVVDQVIGVAMRYEDLSAELQDRVIELLGVKGLIEVVTLVGFYSIIGQVNSVFDVPVDEAGTSH